MIEFRKHDVVIHTIPHQLTALQVLGVMLDAMRLERSVRLWLVVPTGMSENWVKRIRVVLAKQRQRVRTQHTQGQKDLFEMAMSRLFRIHFEPDTIRVDRKTEVMLAYYVETQSQRNKRHMLQHMKKAGLIL